MKYILKLVKAVENPKKSIIVLNVIRKYQEKIKQIYVGIVNLIALQRNNY